VTIEESDVDDEEIVEVPIPPKIIDIIDLCAEDELELAPTIEVIDLKEVSVLPSRDASLGNEVIDVDVPPAIRHRYIRFPHFLLHHGK
jgi:hypothetical protein